jgi:hypothetical protein
MAPKQWTVRLTIKGASGIVLTREVRLVDRFKSNAKHRATQVAVKPGQTVLNVAVVR